jgi:dihydrofolate reductase
MSKIIVFNFISLDGYYKGPDGDISWHRHGLQEAEYGLEQMKKDNILLYGRVTYEMMSGYWQSSEAKSGNKAMAEEMNRAEKIVFSRTLGSGNWNNTRVLKDNITDAIKRMKQEQDKDMAILGSGSIVTQFAEAGLIDEYQIMIDPVALGNGTPIFNGMGKPLNLQLVECSAFDSGVVLLRYQPI